ncbi:MAG: GNAT family N-acetyltransferase [Anaerolineae bacterium]|nr:GNAT family N-acetyltransferase [Anaerolineae bacterium]
MNDITIKQANAEDFETISKLIADQNKNPDTHCIQSDTGNSYQSIHNEMVRLDSDAGICFVMAFQNGEMIGTMGCELDQDLGRGWTRGPFITSTTDEWENVASALLQGLQNILPSTIHQLDSFLNIANERGNTFYCGHGFQQLRLVHVYVATTFENLLENLHACQSIDPSQAQNFVALHESIFTQTYATGQRILDKLGDDHQVFVYTQGDEILGYVYAAIEEDTGDGSVEFIGVREEVRGKGIGRQLLHTALQWLFEGKKVHQAILVVNDNLTNARSLYESVGFRLKYTGINTRKEW